MADVPVPFYLVLLFVALRIFADARKRRAAQDADRTESPEVPPRLRPPAPVRRKTQQEALLLEQLLRGELARRTQTDEDESLEMEPEVVSLETVPARGERAVVDQDDEGEAIARRRIAEAARRDTALGGADHTAFHRRIATAPAVESSAGDELSPKRLRELRRAIVMAEVLGPPLGLRGE